MKLYGEEELRSYMREDWVADMLEQYVKEDEKKVRTQEWLSTTEGKRMIYADMYGDLLHEENKQLRVLDVGGGYNALTKVLARHCDYTLLDFDAHGKPGASGGRVCSIEDFSRIYGFRFIDGDWYKQSIEDLFDIVIANDLFPNVDQRLELFIERYIGKCKEMRLLLTYCNKPRFYITKRVDAEEILTLLAWDGEFVAMKLRKYANRLIDTTSEQLSEMVSTKKSVHQNGRQCAYLRLRGGMN